MKWIKIIRRSIWLRWMVWDAHNIKPKREIFFYSISFQLFGSLLCVFVYLCMCVCVCVFLFYSSTIHSDCVFGIGSGCDCLTRFAFVFAFSHSVSGVEWLIIRRSEVRRKDDDNNQKPNVFDIRSNRWYTFELKCWHNAKTNLPNTHNCVLNPMKTNLIYYVVDEKSFSLELFLLTRTNDRACLIICCFWFYWLINVPCRRVYVLCSVDFRFPLELNKAKTALHAKRGAALFDVDISCRVFIIEDCVAFIFAAYRWFC